MKEYNKLRGGYYTPREISEFIRFWNILILFCFVKGLV